MKMNYEYVQFSLAEKINAQKDMLQSELNIIQINQLITRYKTLRKEELMLKISLIAKIDEIKKEISVLDSILPKSVIKPNISEESEPENLSLEQEIQRIKRKLAALQE